MAEGNHCSEFTGSVKMIAEVAEDFHERFDVPSYGIYGFRLQDRVCLLAEELGELAKAVNTVDTAHIAEEAADCLFVAVTLMESLREAGISAMRKVAEKNHQKTRISHAYNISTGKVVRIEK